MAEILKPPEVAKILGCSPQMVRERIRRGIWDFGECIPKKSNSGRNEFNIYRSKLEKHIGRELTETECQDLEDTS
ncbi:hypothetical protein [Dorea sp. D27]|uniref:hypothetical protein n=1 Tax=Dorea sp. D27 TaxID=658665 RepID=UPI0009FC1090|nr:hypothetical protein [Dorea sp. D27]